MKLLFLIAFITTFGVAGVLNGGGGGVLPENTIRLYELSDIVIASRAELLLFFNAQKGKIYSSGFSESAEFKKLFSSTKSIFEIIKNNAIYVESDARISCKDKDGNDVDGSIVSPKPNSICVSVGRIADHLTTNSARSQVLALVAHEYSHLVGFNETEAEALQKEIMQLVELDSKDHVYQRLYEAKNGFQKLRGAILNDEYRTTVTKDWNYYCQLADSVQKYFVEVLNTRSLKEFSLFDDIGRKTFKSHYQKANSMLNGTCSKSTYYPYRAEMLISYNKIFSNQNTVSAQQYSEHFNDWIVDPNVTISKIDQVSDIQKEIADLKKYIEVEFARIRSIYELYDKYFLY